MAAQTPDVQAILASLTIDEKISLLAGQNFWETVPIPSKGVPSLKTSDGPNGARGAEFANGTTAACFPASVCLAATWDTSLARSIGNALAEETRTKGAHVILAPTVCLHRHPLGGRNFESFSEDPLLAGTLAAEYIKGVQEKGVGATIKHFAANEQETQRFTVNETVSERALRELYLKPFEIAIKAAKPWAVMTAYNMVNGTHADSNEFLLKKVLRGDWGWEGLVMSDWGGTNSTAESINAGLDLEMPGPTRWRSLEQVKKAFDEGKTSEEAITKCAKNVLDLLVKSGKFEDPSTPPEKAIIKPEHQKLIRDVGGSGMVLLKNDGILPLKKEALQKKKIAVLGLAKEALIHGGGSASVNAHYKITPWEGLKAALGEDVEMVFAKGAHTFRLLPPMTGGVTDSEGNPGFTLSNYASRDFSTPAVKSRNYPSGHWCPVLTNDVAEAAVLTGTFSPATTGSHYLGFSGLGPSQLSINDEMVWEQKDNYHDPMGFLLGGGEQKNFQYKFEQGKEYKIEIRSLRPETSEESNSIIDGLMGFYLGFMPEEEHDEDVEAQAVALAKESDLAIVFTGHTKDWETEGQDQASFNLPANGSQDSLVDAVSKVNKNTLVVNSTGVAVAMPWLDSVSAVLQTWFPGQEAGNAIADVLLGKVNPSGRLPVSFPKRLEDAPAHGNFPGEMKDGRLEVEYAEGVFMGYRHYDRVSSEKVLFPFGYGLSYTTFEVSHVAVREQNGGYEVEVAITNTGSVAGAQVVQIYVGPAGETRIEVPVKQLAGFTKATLEPGQSTRKSVVVPEQSFAFFDEGCGRWVVEKGRYAIFVATSAADVVAREEVVVAERMTFAP
ncbi:glycoside hydrolase family 3 protein [Saccharata proteae CBS 121410]|uniref:beta-glucosidase n=1 Tax=Saccharata proteae CBS 121410 TaxID=1314787 RepID=A0A9P4HRE8_9PEZI|nr:glycoside hydrolase family 3 protein [Saccharata proteae CBS 121410]